MTDDGPGPAAQAPPPQEPGATGLGIVGMRERAAMLNGQLTASPRPEGGFAIVARLPVLARPPADARLPADARPPGRGAPPVRDRRR